MDDKTIREFLTYLKINKSYTPKAINRKIATIRSYFDFLVTEGYLKTNPVQKLKSAKLGRHLPKVLTESDIKLFFETLYNTKDDFVIRDIAIFELFYASGIRISELTGINIEDIDFDNMMIKVKGKGDKERIVLINESAYKAINNYLNQRPQVNSRSLFISKKNTRLSARMIEYIFEKYLKKAGINKPASPHTLRHSFATHMLQRGSDLVTIKELLGHANLSTTQIYTNISLQHIKETYNKTHPRE
jgi:site-specific recombinase XerD